MTNKRPGAHASKADADADADKAVEHNASKAAAANMRTYLMLKERAAAFRADPRVQEAMRFSGLDTLAQPTLAAGEKLTDLEFSPEAADRLGKRGFGYVQLSQLAMEHILGAR